MTTAAPRRTYAVVGLCSSVMAVTAGWGLDRGSVWRDEAATLSATRRSLGQLWAMVHHVDVVHGLYYLAMHLWAWPGSGEVWMRVPSVVAATVAAGMVAALGVRLAGPRTGLFAGLTFATIPLVSFYAQELRSYVVVCAAVALTTVLLVRALHVDRWRWWAAYAAAATVTVWLHELAVLLLAAHAGTLLLTRVSGRLWFRWGAAAVTCAVALTPLALVSARQSGQVSWLTTPGAATALKAYAQLAGARPVVILVVAGLAVLGAVARDRTAARPRLAAVAVPLALVPTTALLLVSQWHPLFSERYVLYSVLGVALLAGRGLDRCCARLAQVLVRRWSGLDGPPVRRLATAAGLAVVTAVFLAQLPTQQHLRTVESRSDDLAGAARFVAEHRRPGDTVLFLPDRYRLTALAYPDAFAGLPDLSLGRSAADAGTLRGRERPIAQTRTAMLGAVRIWVVGRTSLRVRSGERGALAERALLTTHFRRVTTARVHGLEVDLFVRPGTGPTG